jgi:release factor glutamine methyltransferase|tara:strand:- start:4307 stop:5119 length:813 start_codon:yes stop_codon:yes gene_type:complete
MISYQEASRKAAKEIDKFDSELLLAFVLKKSREKIFSEGDKKISPEEEKIFNKLVSKRSGGYPLAYILGKKHFWKGEFKVNEHVLVPRPETEILVEEILKENLVGKKILELGTGSGNIAISIASELENLSIYATDKSIEALILARENSLKNNSKNIIFINHDWKDEWLFPEMDFIISNPPYVNKQEISKDEDGIWFEPENALFSNDNGFSDVELIIKKSYFFLKAGGKLFLEHAPNQKASIEQLMDSLNFDSIEFIQDLNKTIRFSILKK